MFNIMLDKLPDNYKGYLIRTDYRIGIQISLALQDAELTEQERSALALTLLYGAGIPNDPEIARTGLQWFLNCGADVQEQDGSTQRSFDFDQDHARIWSGFYRTFGIDLSSVKLHWFQFIAMMGDLKDSAFSDVVEYRMTDTSHMLPETRRAYQKMKEKFALNPIYTAEERQVADDFMRELKGCADEWNAI